MGTVMFCFYRRSITTPADVKSANRSFSQPIVCDENTARFPMGIVRFCFAPFSFRLVSFLFFMSLRFFFSFRFIFVFRVVSCAVLIRGGASCSRRWTKSRSGPVCVLFLSLFFRLFC